ncbi:MAG: hypothetical protein L0154_25310 [Chloroflexi bacterium]|nr:hypothetical protein [Chloroflexota bacterium]
MRQVLAYLIFNGLFLAWGLKWGQHFLLDAVLGMYYVVTSLWLAYLIKRVFRFTGDLL